MRRRQGGITNLEFAVVAALFAILVATFLDALRYQEEQAEKLQVELTVMAMRTGMLSEMADRLIKGRGREADDLLGVNPVRWLQGPPAGYLGEFKEVNDRLVAPGCWYFDLGSGELVYKLKMASHFRRPDGDGKKEIRWRALARGGKGGKVAVEDLVLVPAVTYEWF